MKKLGLILLLITLVLITGCTDTNNPLPEDQTSGNEPTFVSSDGSVPPVNPYNPAPPILTPTLAMKSGVVSTNPLCGELVYCGDMLATSGVSPVTSARCDDLNKQILRNDPHIRQCFMDAYPGDNIENRMPNWNIEIIKIQCMKGRGNVRYCERLGATFGERESK